MRILICAILSAVVVAFTALSIRLSVISHDANPRPLPEYEAPPAPAPKKTYQPEPLPPLPEPPPSKPVSKPKTTVEAPRPIPAPFATKEELGASLFLDPILSRDGKRSCVTCHLPENGLASKGLPLGMDGKPLGRKAPSLLNRAYGKAFFWDGRADSLEAQALDVIGNKQEMGGSVEDALKRIAANEKYRESFRKLYGKLTASTLASCIASFERTIVSGRGRFDEYLDGGKAPLTPSEVRGFDLFRGKAQCYQCHTGPNLTDEGFHNNKIGGDLGRYLVTGKTQDRGAFKTPSLRGVKNHAPYFHNASRETLGDVIAFYNRLLALGLTAREAQDLEAFLRAL